MFTSLVQTSMSIDKPIWLIQPIVLLYFFFAHRPLQIFQELIWARHGNSRKRNRFFFEIHWWHKTFKNVYNNGPNCCANFQAYPTFFTNFCFFIFLYYRWRLTGFFFFLWMYKWIVKVEKKNAQIVKF